MDAIIFGTGFHILDMPIGAKMFDGDGRSLDDHWKGSPQAYLGTTSRASPTPSSCSGPALGTGHTSAFMILEAQLDYLARPSPRPGATGGPGWRPRREVQDAFNAQVQEALATTVYNAGGCQSYFLDVNGRNSFNWPWSTDRMRQRLGRFDDRAYVISTDLPTDKVTR